MSGNNYILLRHGSRNEKSNDELVKDAVFLKSSIVPNTQSIDSHLRTEIVGLKTTGEGLGFGTRPTASGCTVVSYYSKFIIP